MPDISMFILIKYKQYDIHEQAWARLIFCLFPSHSLECDWIKKKSRYH